MTNTYIPTILSEKLEPDELLFMWKPGAIYAPTATSILGEKQIHMSNKGNVYCYDNGGFLGKPHIWVFQPTRSNPVVLDEKEGALSLSYQTYEGYGFSIGISGADFEHWTENYPLLLTSFEEDIIEDKEVFLFKENHSNNEPRYCFSNVSVSEGMLKVDGGAGFKSNIQLPVHSLKKFYIERGFLHIKGAFEGQDVHVILFSPDEHAYHDILFSLNESQSVYSLVSERSIIQKTVINGSFNQQVYIDKILILSKDSDIPNRMELVDDDPLQSLGVFDRDEIVQIDQRTQCIIHDQEIFTLTFDKDQKLEVISQKNKDLQWIGINKDTNIPFFILKNHEYLLLVKNDKKKLKPENIMNQIKYAEMQELKVINANEYISDIRIETSAEVINISVPHALVSKILYASFHEVKKPIIPSMSQQQMFFSYGRHVNDYILYEFFGQLFAIESGIKKIHEDNSIEEKEKQVSLANLMFHGIKAQKKRLDFISIYMPEFLEKEDTELLEKHNGNLKGRPHKKIQNKLMALTSQLNRSISEVENNLHFISNVLYPELSIREKAEKNNYIMSGGMGVAAMAINPLLLVGSAVVAANTFFSSKSSNNLDDHKLDIYVGQALESYLHMMEVLVPYYMSELTNAVFESFALLEDSYLDIKSEDALKNNLLDKISGLYTYKQLPIDGKTNETRNDVIENMHQSLSNTDEYIKNLKQLLEEA